MSTLAWDGRCLAADQQITIGGTPVAGTKIFRGTDFLIGGCGDIQEVLLFVEWYESGQLKTDKPMLTRDSFTGYVVDENKVLWRFDHLLVPYKITRPFWAAGSGADYAMGAMAAGQSARRAVEIAIDLDINSGMGVQWMFLNREDEDAVDI
jgi:ATP-dependent protease HslVU (ClpYQ) peptidase subunit